MPNPTKPTKKTTSTRCKEAAASAIHDARERSLHALTNPDVRQSEAEGLDMHGARRSVRLGRRLALAAVGALASTVATPAFAANKLFATGLMIYSANVSVVTSCKITNYGKKAATIVTVSIANGGGPIAATSDTCTTAPLQPGTACTFGGPGNSVQGGGAASVKGSLKELRGNCTLIDTLGHAVQFDQMR